MTRKTTVLDTRQLQRNSFLRDFIPSDSTVLLTAHWFAKMGYQTTLPPDFRKSDGGDLFLHSRIEVKHRKKTHFTCYEDYPFKDGGVIVCKKKTYYRANPRPLLYVHWNAECTVAIVIDCRLDDRWQTIETDDNGRKQLTLVAPAEDVFFIPADDLHTFINRRLA